MHLLYVIRIYLSDCLTPSHLNQDSTELLYIQPNLMCQLRYGYVAHDVIKVPTVDHHVYETPVAFSYL